MGLACNQIVNGTKFSTWNNAGGGSTLTNQPFESWDFGWGGYRLCKILNYMPDGVTPKQFELRGKNAYTNFSTNYAQGVDGSEVGDGTTTFGCSNILGSYVGLNFDTSVTTATGYTKSGNIFTRSVNECPEPTVNITVPNEGKFTSGASVTLTSDAQNATNYQWYRNNTILTGEVGVLLVISNATANSAGEYYCKATNNCGGGADSSQKDSNKLNLTLVTIITKPTRIYAQIQKPCESAVAQFGYSQIPSIVPTIWSDSQGTVRAQADSNGNTVEVVTGGELYQFKEFSLPLGDYYFYIRQKDNPTNILYIGVTTVQ